MTKKFILSLLLLLSTCWSLNAQTTGPAMADQLRADGKIYVVITVLALIFLALVVFLTLIERRVAKLEKQVNQSPDKK